MNKAKPIEPGCMAMIINSCAGNNGKIVSVIECTGLHKFIDLNDNFTVEFGWSHQQGLPNITGYICNITAESQLMRIDEFEDTEMLIETHEVSA